MRDTVSEIKLRENEIRRLLFSQIRNVIEDWSNGQDFAGPKRMADSRHNMLRRCTACRLKFLPQKLVAGRCPYCNTGESGARNEGSFMQRGAE